MSEHPSRLHPVPRRISRRGIAMLIVGLLAFGAVFAVVVRLYWLEGGVQVNGGVTGIEANDIVIDVRAIDLDPRTNLMTLDLAFEGYGTESFDENGTAVKNTRIFVYSASGTQEFKALAGDQLGRAEVRIGVDGQEADYPFDKYTALIGFGADTYEKSADGSLVSTGKLKIGLSGSGGIDGWDTVMFLGSGYDVNESATIISSRAFSTQIFALLILTLMTVLAFAAFWYSILVVTKRRMAEVTLLAWTASLLFALPVLRNSLPNGPPIGATIDIVVFLWVLAMAMIAASIMIFSYITQRRDQLRAEIAREQADAP